MLRSALTNVSSFPSSSGMAAACTGEEAVFTWRLTRNEAVPLPASPPAPASTPDASSSSSSGERSLHATSTEQAAGGRADSRQDSGSASDGSGSDSEGPSSKRHRPVASAWLVESVQRDGSHDDEELATRPHPRCVVLGSRSHAPCLCLCYVLLWPWLCCSHSVKRRKRSLTMSTELESSCLHLAVPRELIEHYPCRHAPSFPLENLCRLSPEIVIQSQLALLRQGDVVGAAAFNMWNRNLQVGRGIRLCMQGVTLVSCNGSCWFHANNQLNGCHGYVDLASCHATSKRWCGLRTAGITSLHIVAQADE